MVNNNRLIKFQSLLLQLAEEKYEEYEDHVRNITSESDKELAKYVENAVDRIWQTGGDMTDVEMEEVMDDCRRRVTESKSEYFKKAFPDLFME